MHSTVYMRSLFSYDPSVDRHHPCQEAGLKFGPGVVLQIVNQEDPNWWQAVREGDNRTRAGIIPSKTFKKRCILLYMHDVGVKRVYTFFTNTISLCSCAGTHSCHKILHNRWIKGSCYKFPQLHGLHFRNPRITFLAQHWQYMFLPL